MSSNYPLGAPIRPAADEKAEEWVARDPAKPHIQTNTKTGAMRNHDPRREAASAPVWHFPYFGVRAGGAATGAAPAGPVAPAGD